MISKSNDYANEDVLSNFKLVAKLEGSTPIKDIFGHIANKVVRLGNLLGNDKSPLNESVSDSASDLINYLHLLTMAIQEGEVLKSDLYTSSQNENFDNFLKGPVITKTEAHTVNHISQTEKTKLAHEKKSGILSGFDQNGCGRV